MSEQWAAALWQRFKDFYGQKWASLFLGPEAIDSWRITWATGLTVTNDQISYAMTRLNIEFPDWPPTFGQFRGLCYAAPQPQLALPVVPKAGRIDPTPEQLAELARMAKSKRSATDKYWKPSVVTTSQQVTFIVNQARHFGALSVAGRFLTECQDAGVITSDFKLAKQPALRA